MTSRVKKNILKLKESSTLAINEKSKDLIKSGKKIYRFGFGQSPFQIPGKIVDTLKTNAHKKQYLPIQGLTELREKISNYLLKKTGVKYPKENILITPGSKEAMLLMHVTFNGEILTPAPSWVSYEPQAEIGRNKVHWLETSRANNWFPTSKELEKYIHEAVKVSNDAPVLIDKFLNEAIEIDVDAVRDLNGDVFIAGIMQHIEEAGVHSGDSACAIPAYSISDSQIQKIKENTIKMANELDVKGLMNVQFAIKEGKIFVIEVNPRASRTIPFVSKSIGISVAKIAAKCMLGKSIKELNLPKDIKYKYYYVKEVVFPFLKFPGVDPILGPEMKSTGEVMGIGKNFGEAFAKSQIATNVIIPEKGTAFISVKDEDKRYIIDVAKKLLKLGFKLVATNGTQNFLNKNNIKCTRVNKVREGRTHIVDMIKNNQIDLIINTTQSKQAIKDSYLIRREALQYKVCYTTTIAGANALVGAIDYSKNLSVYKLQDIFKLA